MFSLFLVLLAGCHKNSLLADPQLRPIQEMIDSEVHIGSPRANVTQFLNTQGYPQEQSQKPGTIVAIVRKIDTQRLEPVTARVTFTFDANDRLASVEMQKMLNEPVH